MRTYWCIEDTVVAVLDREALLVLRNDWPQIDNAVLPYVETAIDQDKTDIANALLDGSVKLSQPQPKLFNIIKTSMNLVQNIRSITH